MTNLTRNTFVDCTCPLINYLPAADWYRGGYDGDPFTDRYQDSTFMFTNATNATATFSINGYGVHIFGAYRQNHGPYEVTINGTSYGEFRTDDADAPKNDAVDALFQIQLFGIESLPEGTHEVTLINRADPEKNKTLIYVDLDFVGA
ncbi:hypothetical protein FISHEDRAFT_47170 [Fistulina hepatica ATCC 64428]|uniref:Uncharacterized protein n=1 Tax=Fistulina hepatica ATCC 64428 TaxID=1128425 RepID=A0A0D7A6Z9_9AGAR|nr:hypothetical protein FISHEDRAFT_47170 [Fistulina hepatica ATCC 64428]